MEEVEEEVEEYEEEEEEESWLGSSPLIAADKPLASGPLISSLLSVEM